MEPSRTYSTVTPNHRTHELIIELVPRSVADAINLWLLNWTKTGRRALDSDERYQIGLDNTGGDGDTE